MAGRDDGRAARRFLSGASNPQHLVGADPDAFGD
jgi:hypothetical protein